MTPDNGVSVTNAKGDTMTIPDPACMEPDELALWYDGAMNLRQWFRQPMLDPCADCLPSFADEMASQGRCNGTPGVSRMATQSRRPLVSSEQRRESNRAAQKRWRERNQDAIRERRRGYFAERHLWRKTLAEPNTVR